jgi:hypothetical protein
MRKFSGKSSESMILRWLRRLLEFEDQQLRMETETASTRVLFRGAALRCGVYYLMDFSCFFCGRIFVRVGLVFSFLLLGSFTAFCPFL